MGESLYPRLKGKWNPVVQVLKGAFLTTVLVPSYAAPLLGLKGIDAFRYLLIISILGGGLYLTRFKAILYILVGAACLLTFVVLYTPLVPGMTSLLMTEDPVEKADVIVVLGTYVSDTGYLSNEGMNRLLRGIELARAGYASTILMAAYAKGNPTPDLDLANLAPLLAGINLVTAATSENTFDESQAVIQYLQKSGNTKVLLVTSPLHTRRTKAVFQRAGVPALVVPCPQRDNNLSRLAEPRHRWAAFWSCLYESLGLLVYWSQGII